MDQQITAAIQAAAKQLFNQDVSVELTRPDEQFGDFSTNVALQLAGKLGQKPRDVAEQLVAALNHGLHDHVRELTIAGPGFINIALTDAALFESLATTGLGRHSGKRVVLEYSCPNAFKELHTGHLYQTVVGDALGNLLTHDGATVFRTNFGGDVGLHVAKCLYGIIELIGENPDALAEVPALERPSWISAAYVKGSAAYEVDADAKERIAANNRQIYRFHTENDHESPLARIYWECRDWSYEYFKSFYESIQVTPFDKYYPESTTIEPGLKVVEENRGTVFKESDGALVFEGEAVGLHTRVFVTSAGLPTYETKDLGVIYAELADFAFDKRIIMTGNDQIQYMEVIFAALTAIDPELAAIQTHAPNGTVKFGSGIKMSSRLGNVTRAVDVLEAVDTVVIAQDDATRQMVKLGAIKYSFLKHRLGGDIAFDINESVSLEGNSGPYLQYAHARARSILRKTDAAAMLNATDRFEAGERSLVRKLTEYPEVVDRATAELLPHHVCTYLYELSQTFNRFYEHNRVIGDDREALRLGLVSQYADTLKTGLELLGISAPEQM